VQNTSIAQHLPLYAKQQRGTNLGVIHIIGHGLPVDQKLFPLQRDISRDDAPSTGSTPVMNLSGGAAASRYRGNIETAAHR